MHSYKQLAIEAAKEAGEILLSLSKKDINYQMKNAHDILAEGDLKSEETIIKKIKATFPHHSIISEEAGGDITDFDGNPINRNSKNIFASNSSLHDKALKIISSYKVA